MSGQRYHSTDKVGTMAGSGSTRRERRRCRNVGILLGIAGSPGAVAALVSLILDQTVRSWNDGPQLVGHRIGEIPGACIMLPSVALVVLSAAIAAARVIGRVARWKLPTWGALVWIAAVASGFLLAEMSYGTWQHMFIGRFSACRFAGVYMMNAAAVGSVGLVRSYIAEGVDVDSVDSEGRTALMAAAAFGRMECVQVLVEKGADIERVDRGGRDAVELARDSGHADIVDFLEARRRK